MYVCVSYIKRQQLSSLTRQRLEYIKQVHTSCQSLQNVSHGDVKTKGD